MKFLRKNLVSASNLVDRLVSITSNYLYPSCRLQVYCCKEYFPWGKNMVVGEKFNRSSLFYWILDIHLENCLLMADIFFKKICIKKHNFSLLDYFFIYIFLSSSTSSALATIKPHLAPNLVVVLRLQHSVPVGFNVHMLNTRVIISNGTSASESLEPLIICGS